MRRFLVVLLLVLSVGLAHSPVSQEVIDARASFVSIVQYDEDLEDYRRFCSGAVVNDIVLTAGHCLVDLWPGDVFVRDYQGHVYSVSAFRRVFDPDTSTDWAVMYTVATNLLPNIGVASEPPEFGDSVFAWSGPAGFEGLLLEGHYAGRIVTNEGSAIDGMMYVTMNGTGGSSGSVVMNEQAEAIGIVSRGFVTRDRSIIPLTGMILADLPDIPALD